MIVSPQRGGIQ